MNLLDGLPTRLGTAVGTFGSLELGGLAVLWVVVAWLEVALPAAISCLVSLARQPTKSRDALWSLLLAGGWGALVLMMAGDLLLIGTVAAVVWPAAILGSLILDHRPG
jgi:hypothetical protein